MGLAIALAALALLAMKSRAPTGKGKGKETPKNPKTPDASQGATLQGTVDTASVLVSSFATLLPIAKVAYAGITKALAYIAGVKFSTIVGVAYMVVTVIVVTANLIWDENRKAAVKNGAAILEFKARLAVWYGRFLTALLDNGFDRESADVTAKILANAGAQEENRSIWRWNSIMATSVQGRAFFNTGTKDPLTHLRYIAEQFGPFAATDFGLWKPPGAGASGSITIDPAWLYPIETRTEKGKFQISGNGLDWLEAPSGAMAEIAAIGTVLANIAIYRVFMSNPGGVVFGRLSSYDAVKKGISEGVFTGDATKWGALITLIPWEGHLIKGFVHPDGQLEPYSEQSYQKDPRAIDYGTTLPDQGLQGTPQKAEGSDADRAWIDASGSAWALAATSEEARLAMAAQAPQRDARDDGDTYPVT